jgi:type IV secretory pathway TrbD component
MLGLVFAGPARAMRVRPGASSGAVVLGLVAANFAVFLWAVAHSTDAGI